MPLSIIKGVLRGEEGVLAGSGHRALDGRKVLEDQVLGKLATMSELESVVASRATPGWGPQHIFWDLEWARWTGGRMPTCAARTSPEWNLLTPVRDTPVKKLRTGKKLYLCRQRAERT